MMNSLNHERCFRAVATNQAESKIARLVMSRQPWMSCPDKSNTEYWDLAERLTTDQRAENYKALTYS